MKTPVDFSHPFYEGERVEDEYVFIVTRDRDHVEPVCWQAFPGVERESAMQLLGELEAEYKGRRDREVYHIEGRWQDILAEHAHLFGSYATVATATNWRQ